MFETHGLESAAERLKRRVVFLRRRALALDVCLGGSVAALLATVAITLAGWTIPLLLVYGVILALAALVFTLLAWRVGTSALTVLRCADRIQRFQERLSTAYEYLHDHVDNPFVAGLVAEAERVAPQTEPRIVFPGRCPRRMWAIPVLLVATVGFIWLEVSPLRLEERVQDEVSQDVVREGDRLERWGRRLEELAKQQRLDQSLILARHMQNLGRRLKRERGKTSQVTQQISNLSQYLERMQQELRERTLMSEVGAMVARDVLLSGKSVKQELQDILKLLQNDTLPREMAAVAEQGIQRLSQQMGQNPALAELAQNLRAGNLKAARQLLQDIIQQQQAAEEMENLERAQRALQYSSRVIQRGEASGEASQAHSPNAEERMASKGPTAFDDGMMAEDMPNLEDFDTPGDEEGFGSARHNREGPRQALRESAQPPSQVPVKSGEGAVRLAYIRALPVQTEAHVPLEEVVGQYKRAAEEVLSQEKIPRAYREQVKQYFLAIGLTPEDRQ